MRRCLLLLFLLAPLAGCITKNLPPPDGRRVKLVHLDVAGSILGAEAQVRPAEGEQLTYLYEGKQRIVLLHEWNPVLAKQLRSELERRDVDTRKGAELTIGLQGFSADPGQPGDPRDPKTGKSVELVVALEGEGFSQVYTATAAEAPVLGDAILAAIEDLMRRILIDRTFRKWLRR